MFNRASQDAERQANQTERSMGSLDDAFRAISPSTLSAVAGVTALIGAIKGLVGLGEDIVNTASHFEQTRKSLETVLQSAEKGQKLFEDLRKFSFETTFGVDELASASSQLLNVGVSVKQLQGDLKMLGDLAQGDKNKFAELTSIFAKVQSTGKVSSMQLQQFALRGIPIVQTLKDMGITGSTSAENLNKAFKKLTEEGGQFHNAMDNIIDTIEGKRGFITDTLKEIKVNLGEVTGLTDTYKLGLDKLYEVYDYINNKLMELNENPMMKAIIQGVLVTVLTALVGVIAVGLVGALKVVGVELGKIIAKLTIVKTLAGPAGWITLAVAGIAGLITAYKSYQKEQEKIIENNEKIRASYPRQEDYYQTQGQTSRNTRLENLEEELAKYNATLEGNKKNLENAKKDYKDWNTLMTQMGMNKVNVGALYANIGEDSGFANSDLMRQNAEAMYGYGEISESTYKKLIGFIEKYSEEINNNEDVLNVLQGNVAKFDKQIKETNGSIDETEKKINAVKKAISDFGDTSLMKSTFDDLYADIKSKTEKQLETLKLNYDLMETYYARIGQLDNDGKIVEGDKAKVKELLKYLDKQKAELKVKLALENAKDWQESLRKVFNIDDVTASELINNGSKGSAWVEQYLDSVKKQIERKEQTDSRLSVNMSKGHSDYILEQAQDLKKLYENLMEAKGVFGEQDNGVLDTTTQALQDAFHDLQIEFLNSNGSLDAWNEAMDNLKNNMNEASESLRDLIDRKLKEAEDNGNLGDVAKYTTQGAIYDAMSGTDVGSFVETLAITGSPLIALIEVLIKDVVEYIGGFEKLQYLLNIVKNIVQAIAPALDAVLNLVSILAVILKPILDALNTFLKKLFKNWNDWFDEQYKKNEEQKQQQEDLTKSYENLLKAIKEQEEYYIRKKAELNMLALDDKVTKVNDMILTPNGTFSTSPQDTIIATKNPQGLGGGVVNNIKVINNAGVDVNVKENKGANMNEILVTISKKIASDVANGFNGWDGAFAMQKQRVDGRRI